jgi:hypothetical protein
MCGVLLTQRTIVRRYGWSSGKKLNLLFDNRHLSTEGWELRLAGVLSFVGHSRLIFCHQVLIILQLKILKTPFQQDFVRAGRAVAGA